MKIKQIILYTIICIAIIILIGGLAYSITGSKVNTTALLVKDVVVANNKLYITGTTMNSAQAFTGYDYRIANGSLYLTLKYVLVNPFHKSGDFSITIDDNLTEVNKVYLQGRDERDLRLVWSN